MLRAEPVLRSPHKALELLRVFCIMRSVWLVHRCTSIDACMHVCLLDGRSTCSGSSLVCMCVPDRGSTCSSIWLHTKIVLSSCTTCHWSKYYSAHVVFVYAWIMHKNIITCCGCALVCCPGTYYCMCAIMEYFFFHWHISLSLLLSYYYCCI